MTNVNGKNVINFPVAVNRRFPDSNGEMQEKTIWYNCAKWETREGNLWKYLKKGTQVLVEGEPEAKIYKNKENRPAIDNTIRVTMVELLGSKKENGKPDEADNTDYDMSEFEEKKGTADKDEAFWASQAAQEAEFEKMKAAGAGDPATVEQRDPITILEGMDDPFGEIEAPVYEISKRFS